MIIESKFSNGQSVWRLQTGRLESEEICGCCGGTGHIDGADGAERKCPDLCRQGLKTVFLPLSTHVEGPLTVGRVGVEITESPGVDQSGNSLEYDNYKPQSGRREEYMLVETGVGTGPVLPVEQLYASEEEAQAAADELNVTVTANEKGCQT